MNCGTIAVRVVKCEFAPLYLETNTFIKATHAHTCASLISYHCCSCVSHDDKAHRQFTGENGYVSFRLACPTSRNSGRTPYENSRRRVNESSACVTQVSACLRLTLLVLLSVLRTKCSFEWPLLHWGQFKKRCYHFVGLTVRLLRSYSHHTPEENQTSFALKNVP